MCGHGEPEPRRDAHRGRRLDGGDETKGGTLEHAHVHHGFASLSRYMTGLAVPSRSMRPRTAKATLVMAGPAR